MPKFCSKASLKTGSALAAILLAIALVLSCMALAGCSQSQQASSAASASSQNASPASQTATIDATVTIDPALAEGSYDKAAFEGFETPVPVQLEDGATAYDALMATGAEIEGTSSFVVSINGLGEGAAGELSGWMYEVNGETPMVAADEFTVSNDDAIRWYYANWE